MTGLLNRRGLLEDGARLIDRARADGHDVALAWLDLDNFSWLNHTQGHDAGDSLLIEAGDRIRAATRPTDLVGRLGGDEFLVLQVTAGQADPGGLADRLRMACADLHDGVSVGVALCPDDGTTLEQLARAADVRMYDDKRRRREHTPTRTL